MALASALIFLAIIAVLSLIALTVSTSSHRLSGDNLYTYQTQLAAEAGLQRVVAESWFEAYETSENEAPPEDYQATLQSFRSHLDEAGLLAGGKETDGYSFGDAVIYQEDLEGVSYRTSVRRVDVGSSYTLLRVDSVGWIGEAATPVSIRRLSTDIRVQVPQADNQGFAVLGNNANCLFCHTQISLLETSYDKDGKLVNLSAQTTPKNREDTFKDKQRIKIALLENLLTDRPRDMQSLVTGTIYTRGTTNVTVQGGSLSTVPLQTIDRQSTSRLSADIAKVLTDLDTVDCTSTCEKRHALFYKNYPLRHAADGDLPKAFPLLIKDANDNRRTEHSEWRTAIAGDDTLGGLKGGHKAVLGTRATGEYDLELSSTTLSEVTTLTTRESTDGVQGHVVLGGTAANPLVLEGTLYVNGDVVLGGVVTGDGKIVARGNVYITGDITYACDDEARDFNWHASRHVTCNYGIPDTLPRLAVVAGKNILVGAYMTPATSARLTGKPTDQLTRTDFSETSADDLARWFVDPGAWVKDQEGQPLMTVGTTTETRPQALSYAVVQMALFNESEYRKASADSSYIPRFYTLREGGDIFRCGKGFSPTKEDYCQTYGDLINLSGSSETSDQALLQRASRISATPTNAWLGSSAEASELAIRAKWVEGVERRRTPNALHLDGLYYTPNAIFGNVPLESMTQGKILLNGSLAAADIALLAPSGLSINHDERLADMLELNPTTHVMQTLSNYRLLNANEAVDYSPIKE